MCVCRKRCICQARGKILEGPVVKGHEPEGINKELLPPTLYSLSIGGFMVGTYPYFIFQIQILNIERHVNLRNKVAILDS